MSKSMVIFIRKGEWMKMDKANIWNQGIGCDQCNTLETLPNRDMYIKQELLLDVMLCKYPPHHTHQMITIVKQGLQLVS